jgi:PST family polysaccharide transporter
VISFVLGVMLARLLLPEEFGVFAAILVFVEVASSIVSSGIVAALVQRKEVDQLHFTTGLTMSICLGILACVTLWGISPWVGDFYRDETVGRVLGTMSLYLVILPFISIPTAMLRRRIDYRSTGLADVTQQILAGIISVVMAFLGFGVWSLVYGRLSGQAIRAVHLSYLAGWRPSLGWNGKVALQLADFGGKIVCVNVLNDVANNVGYVLTGRILGPQALGFYYRAYYLMTLPLTRITTAMNDVLFSAFSAVQDDVATVKRGVLKAICYASTATFPILVGLFWTAPMFISVVYGANWLPAAEPLKIMCLAGLLLSIEPIMVSAITAKGYAGLELRRQAVYLIILLTLIPIGTRWGIAGVAWAVTVAVCLFMIFLQRLLHRLLGLTWRDLGRAIYPVVAACAAMSLTVWLYQRLAATWVAYLSPSMLAGSVVVGASTYILFLTLWRFGAAGTLFLEVRQEIWSILAKLLARLRGRVNREG